MGFLNYNVYRCDRNVNTSSLSRGGGVLIAVDNKLYSELLITSSCSLEIVFVLIKLDNRICIVSSVYFPISSSVDLYTSYFDIVGNMLNNYVNAQFLLFGDFNLPSAAFSNAKSFFSNNLSFLNFKQINNVLNKNNILLDYVITNSDTCHVSLNTLPIINVDLHHPPLIINHSFPYLYTNNLVNHEIFYNWNKANYRQINLKLGAMNWQNSFQFHDIDYNINLFYADIFSIINYFVPTFSLSNNSNFPKWFSHELKCIIKKKKLSHFAFKNSNNFSDYLIFSNLRSKILRQRDYNNYMNKVQNSINNNPKYFWKFFKDKKSHNSIPSLVNYNKVNADNGQDIVNLFGKFFSNVYKKPLLIIPDTHTIESPFCINHFDITLEDVFYELDNLKLNLSTGPDNLSVIFLYECRFILAPHIHFLFNQSLNSGIFPTLWKTVFISPIFKKGERSSVDNYRPISKISILPKIFSKIINKKMSLIINSFLNDTQHGFRKGHSTITNLAIFKHNIIDSFSAKSQLDTVFTDFEKAFDSVDHYLLIHKLKKFGFCDPLLTWLTSFLTNRIQLVKLNQFVSEPIHVLSGVPQGDHLSPTLFLLFINDINTIIKYSNILLFADDAKIFKKIDSVHDCIKLQDDLNNLYDWCYLNGLSLNINKCKILSFNIRKSRVYFDYKFGNVSIELVESFTDLGTTFDSKLCFNEHIDKITNKAFQNLGFITRTCTNFNNLNAFKNIYFAFVRSQLEYASLIWSSNNIGVTHNLEAVQNRFLRFLAFKFKVERPRHSDYNGVLSYFNIQSLTTRRSNLHCSFLMKLLNNLIDCPYLLERLNFRINTKSTRNQESFLINNVSKTYLKSAPINILMTIGNTTDISFS